MPIFRNDDGEINYDEYLSLADLAHELRWAWLVVNAAIPLIERVPEPVDLGDIIADRSQLRALAFEHVLAQLGEFDFKVRPDIAAALLAGRMPRPAAQSEA